MSGIAGQGAGALAQYLFGSLTTVSDRDLVLVAVLAVVVLVPALGLAPQLFAVCADEEFARTQGLRGGAYNVLIVVLAAVTVALAMRTVGLLLVSALMVVPVAAAQNLVRGCYAALAAAMLIGSGRRRRCGRCLLRRHGSRCADRGAGHRRVRAELADLLAGRPPT